MGVDIGRLARYLQECAEALPSEIRATADRAVEASGMLASAAVSTVQETRQQATLLRNSVEDADHVLGEQEERISPQGEHIGAAESEARGSREYATEARGIVGDARARLEGEARDLARVITRLEAELARAHPRRKAKIAAKLAAAKQRSALAASRLAACREAAGVLAAALLDAQRAEQAAVDGRRLLEEAEQVLDGARRLVVVADDLAAQASQAVLRGEDLAEAVSVARNRVAEASGQCRTAASSAQFEIYDAADALIELDRAGLG